jgi:hypothetical protein
MVFMENLKALGNAVAILEKVQTQKDGGFRVTLDLSDTEINLVSELLRVKSDPTQSPMFYVTFIKKPEDSFL